jgi:hemerythrin-like metal-binding protein
MQSSSDTVLNDEDLPIDRRECMCGSPATGRVLAFKATARPALINFRPRPRAKAYARRPGALMQAMLAGSECTTMLGSLFISRYTEEAGRCLPKPPFIVWTNQMSVDVKLLDNDHRKIALLINEIHDGIWAGSPKPQLVRVFEELIWNIRNHYSNEEQLFAETKYPDAAIHIHEHEQLMERVLDLQARFKHDSDLDSYLEIVNLLKGWLFSHVEISDREYVPHLKKKCVDTISILAARQFPTGSVSKRSATGPRAVQCAW